MVCDNQKENLNKKNKKKRNELILKQHKKKQRLNKSF